MSTLSIEIESESLKDILNVLEQPVYPEMLETLQEIICDEARAAKGTNRLYAKILWVYCVVICYNILVQFVNF